MLTVASLVEMGNEFIKKHNRHPTKLYLTFEDETDLILSVCQHLTDVSINEVTVSGRLKDLFPKIHGMEVIYESDKTYLE